MRHLFIFLSYCEMLPKIWFKQDASIIENNKYATLRMSYVVLIVVPRHCRLRVVCRLSLVNMPHK